MQLALQTEVSQVGEVLVTDHLQQREVRLH
jgi:hypothetical protein